MHLQLFPYSTCCGGGSEIVGFAGITMQAVITVMFAIKTFCLRTFMRAHGKRRGSHDMALRLCIYSFHTMNRSQDNTAILPRCMTYASLLLPKSHTTKVLAQSTNTTTNHPCSNPGAQDLAQKFPTERFFRNSLGTKDLRKIAGSWQCLRRRREMRCLA